MNLNKFFTNEKKGLGIPLWFYSSINHKRDFSRVSLPLLPVRMSTRMGRTVVGPVSTHCSKSHLSPLYREFERTYSFFYKVSSRSWTLLWATYLSLKRLPVLYLPTMSVFFIVCLRSSLLSPILRTHHVRQARKTSDFKLLSFVSSTLSLPLVFVHCL